MTSSSPVWARRRSLRFWSSALGVRCAVQFGAGPRDEAQHPAPLAGPPRFALRAETLCQAAGRWYAVMNAQYTGAAREPDGLFCLTGLTNGQPGCSEYYAVQNEKLKKYRLGLPEGEENEAVGKLIAELEYLSKRDESPAHNRKRHGGQRLAALQAPGTVICRGGIYPSRARCLYCSSTFRRPVGAGYARPAASNQAPADGQSPQACGKTESIRR